MGEGSLLLAAEHTLVVLLDQAAEDGLDGGPRVVALPGAVAVHSTNYVSCHCMQSYQVGNEM